MLTHHNFYPNMSFMWCASIFGCVFHSKSTHRFGLDSLKCCLNDTNLIIFDFYMQYLILDFRRFTIHCHRCHFLSSLFFFLRWKIENLFIVSLSIVSGFSGADLMSLCYFSVSHFAWNVYMQTFTFSHYIPPFVSRPVSGVTHWQAHSKWI